MFRRAKPPDPEAFRAEVLTFVEPLFGTALRLTRNRADAEDLVQDTLVKAFRFADRFESGTNLRAWLYTILHNTWRNQRRDAARGNVDVDSERVEAAAASSDGPTASDTPERILMRSTLDADLQGALDALPEAFREAVWLRHSGLPGAVSQNAGSQEIAKTKCAGAATSPRQAHLSRRSPIPD